MYKNPDCFFCHEIEDPNNNILGRSRVVFETKNFVVFPTVGCFRIGYLLIMPKQHYLSFGELEPELIDELNSVVQRIKDFVYEKLNLKCIVFEHGTRDLSKLTSTSIMHAHIHIIPFDADIINALPDYCELKKIKGFEDLKKETDNYLFLSDTSNNSYIVKNDGYPSQFFRQIACKAMGIPKYWDWRRYKFVENMEITCDFYDRLSD